MARESLARLLLAAALLAALTRDTSALEPRNVRLLGTIVSSDPASSQAVIDDSGKQRVVRAGMEIGGAEIVEIQSEAVLLRRSGQLEKLTLGSISVASLGQTDAVPASPAPGGADGAAPGAPASRRPQPASPGVTPRASSGARAGGRSSGSSARPAEAETPRSNDQILADLAEQARFAPVMDNDGKLRGVAVMSIVSDSIIERLGLQSDDVIIAVQGTPIDSSGRAMNVARSLNPMQPVRLDIERHGSPTVVTVNPSALYRP